MNAHWSLPCPKQFISAPKTASGPCLTGLALQIADEVVRGGIESNCGFHLDQGIYWYDTANTDERDAIDRAIRYIELREPDAFPFRFIRHPQQPHLVRFKDLP